MFLLLVFVLLLIVLAAALYVGSLFFQGYIYTQPAIGLEWRAPAAAAVLATFFTFWCFIVTRSNAVPGNIPYDALHRFSPKVEMFADPAPKLWMKKTDGTTGVYVRKKNDNLQWRYTDERRMPWPSSGVASIELEDGGKKIRFDKTKTEGMDYPAFVSPDGWTMMEFDDGPTGLPFQSRWGRFFANVLLNFVHATLWVVCLWLLLQFRFNESLGFGFVLWMFTTLVILPMLLDQSAAIARDRISASPR